MKKLAPLLLGLTGLVFLLLVVMSLIQGERVVATSGSPKARPSPRRVGHERRWAIIARSRHRQPILPLGATPPHVMARRR